MPHSAEPPRRIQSVLSCHLRQAAAWRLTNGSANHSPKASPSARTARETARMSGNFRGSGVQSPKRASAIHPPGTSGRLLIQPASSSSPRMPSLRAARASATTASAVTFWW